MLFPSKQVFCSENIALYTVENIEVDITSRTVTQARKKALLQGQRKALNKILERLTAKFDRGFLPQIPDNEVVNYVHDFIVKSEKTSSVRYIANLTIRLKSDEVKKLLQTEGIAFTENKSEPVVIVPLFRTWANATPLLWEENNPWRVAWMNGDFKSSLVPIVVPYGDLTDISIINALQASRLNTEPLKKLADNYGVKKVYVAEATVVGGNEPKIEVLIRLAGARLGEQNRVTVERQGDGDINEVLSQATKLTVKEIEDIWKQNEVVQFDVASELVIMVPVKKLSDWINVRDQLKNISLISAYDLQAMKKDRVQIKISFSGSIGRLISTLAKHNFSLEHAEGYWILQTSN